MNKKILVGSIIAVVILVLVSFTGVVGYSSVKSNSGNASPLFKVRTNRAIGEESKDIACEYVGKGITLPFPKRDDKAVMVQKVIDRIRLMDDKTFDRFIAYIINYAQKDNRLNNIKPDRIKEALNLVRDSDKIIFDLNTKNKYFPLWTPACTPPPITFGKGIEGILLCFIGLLWSPFVIFMLILNLIFNEPCGGHSCKIPCTAMI